MLGNVMIATIMASYNLGMKNVIQIFLEASPNDEGLNSSLASADNGFKENIEKINSDNPVVAAMCGIDVKQALLALDRRNELSIMTDMIPPPEFI